jgi:hypothetical protein
VPQLGRRNIFDIINLAEGKRISCSRATMVNAIQVEKTTNAG